MHAHYKYRNELNIFNLDYLSTDTSIQKLIRATNKDNRYI